MKSFVCYRAKDFDIRFVLSHTKSFILYIFKRYVILFIYTVYSTF